MFIAEILIIRCTLRLSIILLKCEYINDVFKEKRMSQFLGIKVTWKGQRSPMLVHLGAQNQSPFLATWKHTQK